MIRNAPHRAVVSRRVRTVVEGSVTWVDQPVGTVAGRFALTDLDPASPSAATGSGAASLYVDPGADVEPEDRLLLTEPPLGTWRVTVVRWSPTSQRLVLSRV